MATLSPGYSFGATEQVTNTKLGTLVSGATLSALVNADVDSSAAIANSKLNLSSISQAVALTGGLTLSSNGQTMTSVAANWAKGSDIASATTTDIGAMTGNYADVTGTTTITGLGTVQAGTFRIVRFTGALTLTHNGTSLLLPSAANITTVANDVAGFVSLGSGNWKCVWYQRYDGTSLVAGPVATQSEMETASSTLVVVTPGRQQYHPSSPKAWCRFDGTATGTNAPSAGYNVTSVTRNSAGNYTINLTTAMSSTSYCVQVSGYRASSAGLTHQVSATATGGPTVITPGSDGNAADWDIVHVTCFGDQ